jgi:lysozyme
MDSRIKTLLIFLVITFCIFRPSFDIQHTPNRSVEKIVTSLSENSAIGIDVSHYQGKINWDDIKQSNIQFAYIKATDGITYLDPNHKLNVTNITESGLFHGSYHFYEPNYDAEKQARHFLKHVKFGPESLRPVLDVEISKGQDKLSIKNGVHRWLTLVEQESGCKPMLYSYSYFYDLYLGSTFDKYQLWLADYANKLSFPKSHNNIVMWQHSQKGRVNGIKGHVDLNITEVPIELILCGETIKEKGQ